MDGELDRHRQGSLGCSREETASAGDVPRHLEVVGPRRSGALEGPRAGQPGDPAREGGGVCVELDDVAERDDDGIRVNRDSCVPNFRRRP